MIVGLFVFFLLICIAIWLSVFHLSVCLFGFPSSCLPFYSICLSVWLLPWVSRLSCAWSACCSWWGERRRRSRRFSPRSRRRISCSEKQGKTLRTYSQLSIWIIEINIQRVFFKYYNRMKFSSIKNNRILLGQLKFWLFRFNWVQFQLKLI